MRFLDHNAFLGRGSAPDFTGGAYVAYLAIYRRGEGRERKGGEAPLKNLSYAPGSNSGLYL